MPFFTPFSLCYLFRRRLPVRFSIPRLSSFLRLRFLCRSDAISLFLPLPLCLENVRFFFASLGILLPALYIFLLYFLILQRRWWHEGRGDEQNAVRLKRRRGVRFMLWRLYAYRQRLCIPAVMLKMLVILRAATCRLASCGRGRGEQRTLSKSIFRRGERHAAGATCACRAAAQTVTPAGGRNAWARAFRHLFVGAPLGGGGRRRDKARLWRGAYMRAGICQPGWRDDACCKTASSCWLTDDSLLFSGACVAGLARGG